MYVRSAVSSPYILTHFVGIGIHAFLDLKMKLSWSRCVFISVLIAAGFQYLAEVAYGANEFRKCYNTSVEMHCFDLQYDTTNRRWLTASFDSARQRCNSLNSTLPIIENEETHNNVQNYISDYSNPLRNYNFWTDAYRVNDYSNTYTWHWVNSKLPNLTISDVGYGMYIYDGSYYTTTLECRSDNGNPLQFYLTAKQPQDFNSYLCEYSVSRCPSSGSKLLQFSDRCYISFIASVSWFEARNRCLKDGGDLASFDVTSVNFTACFGFDENVRFWIGLRFTWHIWKDSGEEAKFSKILSANRGEPSCRIICSNCYLAYSWSATDCNVQDSINVVCHTVTPLPTTTLTTTSTTTLPVTTSVDIKTQTETTQPNNPGSKSSRIEKSSGSPPIGVAVGVGVGVGVPVIVAIIVIVICVVRKHKSKTQESSATRQESREETSHTEYQNNNGYSEDSELNHYAIVHPSSPPKMVDQEPSSEPQYAILGFNESADRKSDIGHFPLNVL